MSANKKIFFSILVALIAVGMGAALLIHLLGGVRMKEELPGAAEQLKTQADAAPELQPSPEPTPEPTPEPIVIGGTVYAPEETALDLSNLSETEVLADLQQIGRLEQLESINFMHEDGTCDILPEALNLVHQTAPNAVLNCSFELFGKMVSSTDERIEYDKVEIGNEGLEQIHQALPLLNSCTYFLLADCGIDYERLAELRDAFPERNIVWRVWLFGDRDPWLTDIELFRTTRVGDADAEYMKYFNKVKYIDVGHQQNLSTISFCAGMPKLEVLILAQCAVTDLTPLENCPELEFLELQYTPVTDLTPLQKCTKLAHLMVSHCKQLTDISPLYDLNLQRLYASNVNIPQEQQDEIMARHPETEFAFWRGEDIWNWRFQARFQLDDVWTAKFHDYTERYRLLRQQMRYDEF